MAVDKISHHYVTVNGIKLHYVRQGAGDPLLLIHGWPGFWFEWHMNIGPLAQQYDVIVPDMRGFAYSDKPDVPPEEGYTDVVFAEDLRALCDFYHFEKVRIVTHDFGAVWVQRFARMYPERVEKLVMFDPPYAGIGTRWFQLPQIFQSWYQIFHQQPWAEDLVGSSREATEIYLRHFLSAWSANKDLWTDDEIEAYVEAYSQPGALRGGFNCYRAAFRGFGQAGPGTAKVTPKTLVLWGDGDSILPYEWSDKLGDTFEDFTLKKIEGAGHFMMREAPDRVNAEILAFMK
ncbi:MAG: alpha/beta hydrolase [Dehalococcoidia bacterium]